MGFFDLFTSPDTQERQYLHSLGQPDVPSDITFESPSTSIDRPERQELFPPTPQKPTGLPDAAHSGALAQLARASAASDQGPPQTQTPPAPGGTSGQVPRPTGQGAPGSRVWNTTDRAAIANMQRDVRQAQAESSLAHSVGVLVRMAATYGMGGAAAGAGAGSAAGAGAGEAAAAGSEAGASSAAAGAGGPGASSFGGDFMHGFMGTGGGNTNSWGSMLGGLARREAGSMTSGGGGGGGGGGGTGLPASTGGGFTGQAMGAYSDPANKGLLASGVLADPAKRAWAQRVLSEQPAGLVTSTIPWAAY